MKSRMPIEEVESKPVFEAVQTLPAIYCVINKQQNILPIHSLTQAQDIAKRTNGAVWEIMEDGEGFIFSHPID